MKEKSKKQTKVQSDSKKPKNNMAEIEKGQRKQQRMMENITNREKLMKWLLVAAVVLILLLLLFFGYATDWLKGIHKDSATTGTTPISSSLDTAKSATTGTAATTGTGTTGSSTKSTNTGTDSTTGKSSTSNTTNTTNNSTTTNTTTTGGDPGGSGTTTPSSGVSVQASVPLLNLYADTSTGDGITATLNNASVLGVTKTCHSGILIQICDFTDGNGNIVTTNNLLGTGLITSVTKNF